MASPITPNSPTLPNLNGLERGKTGLAPKSQLAFPGSAPSILRRSYPLSFNERLMAAERGTYDRVRYPNDAIIFNLALVENFSTRTKKWNAWLNPPVGLYRGAMPESFAAYKKIAEHYRAGVIIDLRGPATTPPEQIAFAKACAEASGMKYVYVPLNSKMAPSPQDFKKVEAAIEEARKNGYSAYIHCKHGVDRTGIMVANHEVKAMNLTPEQAFRNMQRRGYNVLHRIRMHAMETALLGRPCWVDWENSMRLFLANIERELTQALSVSPESGTQKKNT